MKNKKAELSVEMIIVICLGLLVFVLLAYFFYDKYTTSNDSVNPFTSKLECNSFNGAILPAGEFDRVGGSTCVGNGQCDITGDGASDEGTVCCIPDKENPRQVTDMEESGCCTLLDYCS